MTEQYRSPDRTTEGCQIGCHVVDRGDESPVQDMGDGDEKTACKRNRKQNADHGRSLAETGHRNRPRQSAPLS